MNEHERLAAKCEAQEAEILRLNQAFDDLKNFIFDNSYNTYEHYDQPDRVVLTEDVVEEINKITGIKK